MVLDSSRRNGWSIRGHRQTGSDGFGESAKSYFSRAPQAAKSYPKNISHPSGVMQNFKRRKKVPARVTSINTLLNWLTSPPRGSTRSIAALSGRHLRNQHNPPQLHSSLLRCCDGRRLRRGMNRPSTDYLTNYRESQKKRHFEKCLFFCSRRLRRHCSMIICCDCLSASKLSDRPEPCYR